MFFAFIGLTVRVWCGGVGVDVCWGGGVVERWVLGGVWWFTVGMGVGASVVQGERVPVVPPRLGLCIAESLVPSMVGALTFGLRCPDPRVCSCGPRAFCLQG